MREGTQEREIVAREPAPPRHRVEVDCADLETAKLERDERNRLDALEHYALGLPVALVEVGLVDEHGLARPQHFGDDARRERLDAVELAVGEVATGADLERDLAVASSRSTKPRSASSVSIAISRTVSRSASGSCTELISAAISESASSEDWASRGTVTSVVVSRVGIGERESVSARARAPFGKSDASPTGR